MSEWKPFGQRSKQRGKKKTPMTPKGVKETLEKQEYKFPPMKKGMSVDVQQNLREHRTVWRWTLDTTKIKYFKREAGKR